MTFKYISLILGLSVGIATQAMEPVASYKEKKAAHKEACSIAEDAYDYRLLYSLRAQFRNEKVNHSLEKTHATAINIQFAKAVEANDDTKAKELIGQGANVNIKWLGKPALIHALSNKTVNLTLIESLLSSPHIDINAQDKQQNTALITIQKHRKSDIYNTRYTALATSLESAKLLIQRNDCNFNTKNIQNDSVLSLAARVRDGIDAVDDAIINLILDRAELDAQKNSAVPKKEASLQTAQHKKNTDALLANRAGTYFALLPTDVLNLVKQANFIPKPIEPIGFFDFERSLHVNKSNKRLRKRYKERIEKIREDRKKAGCYKCGSKEYEIEGMWHSCP